MKRVLFGFVCLVLVGSGFAQDKKFGIKFSGFVKNDFIFDSRQTVAAREGHFLLWPAAEKLDINSEDINAKSNLNFLAIQSRLTGKVTGPDAFGAKTSAVLEGAFFGHSNADINGFRLRHAYGRLNWENTELLFGQTWNPMFIAACFPGVVSFNTGAPFQPFSRNPQIRLTQSMGDLKLEITAFTQRDFTSAGGSTLLRNSSLPEVHLGFSYNKKGNTEILAGVGASYKTLVPRLQTGMLYLTNESVSSYITEAYFKVKTSALTFKFEGVYGQNTYDVLGISSFALVSMNPDTDYRTYTALNSMSVWSEVVTAGKMLQFGLFGGYTKNLGAGQTVMTTQFGTRSNIDYVYRIAPRVILNSGKVRFATELEYTAAAFGVYGSDGTVMDAVPVANMRILVAAYYFF
ncbi:MAG: hypothetical protein J7L96_09580 [Bacteroidales bacterium]|nr:hypothetical protein [Bacteroidales bacterium]